MVALFALEAGQSPRPTTDIDLLADARQRPSATKQVASQLKDLGANLHKRGGLQSDRGFRFEVPGGHIVDILDGLHTIQIPGGTQALRRTELVEIIVDGHAATLRRPTLIAAILLKARALLVHSRPDDQRYDLITLLALLTDPRTARQDLTKAELGWIRKAEPHLKLEDPSLSSTFDEQQIQTAKAALRILLN